MATKPIPNGRRTREYNLDIKYSANKIKRVIFEDIKNNLHDPIKTMRYLLEIVELADEIDTLADLVETIHAEAASND